MDTNQDSLLKDKPTSSKYASRRTVTSDEIVNVPILDVGVIDDTTLGILVYLADDKCLLKFNTNNDFDDDKLYNVLLDNIDSNGLDKENIQDKELSIAFNDHMNKFGFEIDKYKYDCEYINDESNVFQTDNISEHINYILYNREFSKEEGWVNRISDIKEINSEKMEITISTSLETTISWIVEIPKTTEENVSEVAKLIENEGGGLPTQLNNDGYANVVHKNDINDDLNYVEINDNEWVLVVNETYQDWIDKNNKKSKEKNTKVSGNKSKSNTKVKKDAKSKMSTYIFQHILLVSFILVFKPLLIPDPSNLSQVSQNLIESLNTITHFMIIISGVFMIIGLIYQYMRYIGIINHKKY